MAITVDGIGHVVDFLAGEFDSVEVLDAAEVETESKVPITEALTGRVRTTAFFDNTEANFAIAKVRLYAGLVLIAENAVDVTKTDRQSLTVVRKDHLEAV